MEIKTNLNISELHNENPLHQNQIIRVGTKYLFSLIGFGLGSIISILVAIFDDNKIILNAFTAHSDFPHIAIPVLFGFFGAVYGYFYGKRVIKRNSVFQDLFMNQQTLNLILDSMPQMISYLDTDFRFRYNNKSYEKWLGLSSDEIYGEKLQNIVNETNFDLIASKLANNTKNEIINIELSRIFNDKELHSMTMVIPHVGTDNKVKGFFSVVTDISELRNRENKIKEQKDELAELNATKDKFFSLIAHDLKNPFNSMLGFSEILHHDYDELDEETKKQFISSIYENTANTYKLLENLLSWSRAQSGQISFNPTLLNIRQLVNENISLLNQMAACKNIRLHSDLDLDYFMNSDADLVNAVLRNLITNAIKFTPENGQITISANLPNNTKTKEWIEISVKDSGVGISPEILTKLFGIDKNYSSKGTNGESGTGLGLMLCKEFISKCGGEIRAESLPGKGSIFSFTLPIS